MAVEVASRAVVVLGGSRVGVASEYLCVSQRDACVESIRDGGVAQGERTNLPGDRGGASDALDHSVDVASVDRVARERSQNERTVRSFASAGLEYPQDSDCERHGGWLVSFADEVEHAGPRSVSA